MTDDERTNLLELKTFLQKAILLVNEEISQFSPDGEDSNYRFLANKAIMYRDN